MAVAQLRCDADSVEIFHIMDITYRVSKKTALLHCTANQAGTGRRLYFRPKNPAMAKFGAINNKNGFRTAEA